MQSAQIQRDDLTEVECTLVSPGSPGCTSAGDPCTALLQGEKSQKECTQSASGSALAQRPKAHVRRALSVKELLEKLNITARIKKAIQSVETEGVQKRPPC